jgi:hypothetical protein
MIAFVGTRFRFNKKARKRMRKTAERALILAGKFEKSVEKAILAPGLRERSELMLSLARLRKKKKSKRPKPRSRRN